jgi:hypothetical protein
MEAAYVFRVRFRLDPDPVRLDPAEFETVVRRPAKPPGEDGWLFFRNTLWRGEVSDVTHLEQLASKWLDVPVVSVSFQELETDQAYLEALREAIHDTPGAFDGDSPRNVLHKHLGSSIRVE